MSKEWTDDITSALKMLKARGGALDLKAAELIEELWGRVNNDLVRAARNEELRSFFAAKHDNQLHKENVTLRSRLADERHAYDSIRGLIRTALLAEGRDDKDGNGLNLGLGDLVQILIAEWHGARHELAQKDKQEALTARLMQEQEEMKQGRRKYKLADLLLDERSSLSDDFARGAQWSPDQIASLETLRQATKAAMIPVLKEVGMIDD